MTSFHFYLKIFSSFVMRNVKLERDDFIYQVLGQIRQKEAKGAKGREWLHAIITDNSLLPKF